MKLFIWIIGVTAGLALINYKNIEQYRNEENPTKANTATKIIREINPITNIQTVAFEQSQKIQENALKQLEIRKREEFNAKKVKIYVRAKDTKTCMRILKIDVINNEVAECNKDHVVEVRNDEVEKFKKDNEI